LHGRHRRQKPTHTAFALKRHCPRQRFTKWLEVGVGWQRENSSFQGFLDRTPIGGWTGFVHFEPVENGVPPLPPERPAQQQQQPTDDADEQGLFGDKS
jgi:hypothetical protein